VSISDSVTDEDDYGAQVLEESTRIQRGIAANFRYEPSPPSQPTTPV
jgi:hypothetical protein